MISIKVDFPKGQRQRLASLLDPKRMARAESEALNRTLNNLAPYATAKVGQYMGIPTSKLYRRRRFVTSKSNKMGSVGKGRKASRWRLRAELVGRGRPFNVTRWRPRDIKAGGKTIGVAHSAWGERDVALHAFTLWTKAGRPVVIPSRRLGKDESGRNRLRGVFGPGVAQTMEVPQVNRWFSAFATRAFRKHWPSRVRYWYTQAP